MAPLEGLLAVSFVANVTIFRFSVNGKNALLLMISTV
jgi:hypothetical protein